MTTTPISAIELRVISCKDLRSFNFFQKLSVYTAVSIVTEEEENNKKLRHQLQKTPLDKEGDGNPEWNHDVRFNLKEVNNNSNILDIDSTFLEFHFIAHGVLFGRKRIGEVRVPFTDLVGEYNGAVRFISYQVKNPEGGPNGVLNFSYKLIEEEKMKKKANKIPRKEEKMKKKANKIPRNGLYPEIEVDDIDNVLVSTSYPPSPPGNQILYPTTPAEVLYPPPASEVCCWEPPPPLLYPPPPQPEVCCMEPPPFYFPPPPPLHHEVAFYPPPPLPHPIVHGVPPPPPPYGGYSYPMRSTVEYRHHSFDGDTWPH